MKTWALLEGWIVDKPRRARLQVHRGTVNRCSPIGLAILRRETLSNPPSFKQKIIFTIMNLIQILKIASIFIAGISTILAVLPFIKATEKSQETQAKNKITVAGRFLLILVLISVITAVVLQVIEDNKKRKEDHELAEKEKENRNQELKRFELNLLNMYGIQGKLDSAYLRVVEQERTNNNNHGENIRGILAIIDSLTYLSSSFEVQSLEQNQYFSKTIDSLNKVAESLKLISKRIEKENYPFVPFKVTFAVSIPYLNSPFETTSWCMHMEDSSFQEWFTYNNKTGEVSYGHFCFPEFVDVQQAIDEFIRSFEVELGISQDSINCFQYPSLLTKYTNVRNGALTINYNNYDNYILTVYNSYPLKEMIFEIEYLITTFNPKKNICNYNSVQDFTGSNLNIRFSWRNPSIVDIGGNVNYEDTKIKTKRRKRGNKITIYEERHSTVKSKYVTDKLIINCSNLALVNRLEIKYGKNFEIFKELNIIEKDKKYYTDEWGWYVCEGRCKLY